MGIEDVELQEKEEIVGVYSTMLATCSASSQWYKVNNKRMGKFKDVSTPP